MSNVMKHCFDKNKHDVFIPRNKEKYVGKEPPIVRSSWERMFCQWCDSNPGVIRWTSETLEIEYFDPVRSKKRRYYPDFVIQTIGSDNKIITTVVEIKPYKETIPPKQSKKKSQNTWLYESATFATNMAKWRAATDFCRRRGYEFKIITEKQLLK